MGRRSGFEGFLRAAARAAAAAERERQRSIRTQLADARRAERHARALHNQTLRDQRQAEREAKALYLQEREQEVQDMNAELRERVDALNQLLAQTLQVDDRIDFDSLRISPKVQPFQLPPELVPGKAPARPTVPPLTWLQKLWPGSGKRHADRVLQVNVRYKDAVERFNAEESEKQTKAEKRRLAHEKLVAVREAEAAARNAEIEQMKEAYEKGESEAVVAYCEMVLARSEYPQDGFPQEFRLAYSEESNELVVEYVLPEPDIVPGEVEYRYVKTRDAIEPKPRKAAEMKAIYQDVLAAIALRTLHELFEADQVDALKSIVFTGIRDTHDLATGHDARVPVLSVRALKEEFSGIRLEKVEKLTCLRNLGAQVAARPDELQAVKPVVEFDMADKRFVEDGDALSGLESRPNLMELTPTQFEVLVSNLFTKMGLDTKLTRASRDGGVDAVAFDVRPVVGGKVVIQAKRYKDTVGVAAVRDLYGTMQHEGANKGVLVCTSAYGPDAFQFSKDKPIELIDGGGLLYLLREHAGVAARIVIH